MKNISLSSAEFSQRLMKVKDKNTERYSIRKAFAPFGGQILSLSVSSDFEMFKYKGGDFLSTKVVAFCEMTANSSRCIHSPNTYASRLRIRNTIHVFEQK